MHLERAGMSVSRAEEEEKVIQSRSSFTVWSQDHRGVAVCFRPEIIFGCGLVFSHEVVTVENLSLCHVWLD